ncbi:uncharacterized protein AMSG_10063 [Thecamonas trahens ATCC 50062]|uniref:C2H2-type domain-containing protein n=1 Tax=Thecamonas trahens ATCC 50062 TaxID=461836 RepID=A0A0L0DPS9_THETB|nr:hypothetical protein AMSG_10063 [Thecamonas trahens ATCC 50062]KNC54265.1 hypothetical protein AMSG_10063 [Thecamonas trahens ATCC 50062]|eukprot:XP_013753898.1 hypothetical protein AMSG_10063 [Thecamonas trahens ATCC 50062]
MGFGKDFVAAQYPPWAAHYVPYDKLKSLATVRAASGLTPGDTARSPPRSHLLTADLSSPPQSGDGADDGRKEAFFSAVTATLESLNQFVVATKEELFAQLQDLYSELHSESVPPTTGSPAWMVRVRLLDAAAHFVSFVPLNASAVMRAMRKHDKATGAVTALPFKKHILEVQPFYRTDLRELVAVASACRELMMLDGAEGTPGAEHVDAHGRSSGTSTPRAPHQGLQLRVKERSLSPGEATVTTSLEQVAERLHSLVDRSESEDYNTRTVLGAGASSGAASSLESGPASPLKTSTTSSGLQTTAFPPTSVPLASGKSGVGDGSGAPLVRSISKQSIVGLLHHETVQPTAPGGDVELVCSFPECAQQFDSLEQLQHHVLVHATDLAALEPTSASTFLAVDGPDLRVHAESEDVVGAMVVSSLESPRRRRRLVLAGLAGDDGEVATVASTAAAAAASLASGDDDDGVEDDEFDREPERPGSSIDAYRYGTSSERSHAHALSYSDGYRSPTGSDSSGVAASDNLPPSRTMGGVAAFVPAASVSAGELASNDLANSSRTGESNVHNESMAATDGGVPLLGEPTPTRRARMLAKSGATGNSLSDVTASESHGRVRYGYRDADEYYIEEFGSSRFTRAVSRSRSPSRTRAARLSARAAAIAEHAPPGEGDTVVDDDEFEAADGDPYPDVTTVSSPQGGESPVTPQVVPVAGVIMPLDSDDVAELATRSRASSMASGGDGGSSLGAVFPTTSSTDADAADGLAVEVGGVCATATDDDDDDDDDDEWQATEPGSESSDRYSIHARSPMDDLVPASGLPVAYARDLDRPARHHKSQAKSFTNSSKRSSVMNEGSVRWG